MSTLRQRLRYAYAAACTRRCAFPLVNTRLTPLPQTYYLTVDLSLPEFVYRNPSGIMHFGRGGYYADFINDPDSEHKRSMAHRVVPPGGKMTDDEDEDSESLPEREDDLDEEDPDLERFIPHAQDDGTEVADDKLGARDIEILDLHTEHPIISYRGKVFEGSWAEILGVCTGLYFCSGIPPLKRCPHHCRCSRESWGTG